MFFSFNIGHRALHISTRNIVAVLLADWAAALSLFLQPELGDQLAWPATTSYPVTKVGLNIVATDAE